MKQELCLVCGKKGHRKADCPNKDSIDLIEEQGTKSIWTSVLINGILFNGMIDTGSSITLVNDKVVKDCNLALKNTSRTFTTASIPCQIEKETMVEIQMGVNNFELPVCVWDNKKYDLLIGLDFLKNVDSIDIKEMKLHIENREVPIQTNISTENICVVADMDIDEDFITSSEVIQPVNWDEVVIGGSQESVKQILLSYPKCYSGKLGCTIPIYPELQTTGIPRRSRPYRASQAQRQFIDDEIQYMLNQGIIEEVTDHTEYAASVEPNP
eukprot:NODE_837_length_3597_cov_0.278445.p2 type:complete len:269 gc:universal NODE_837_length_3597_cov_0.278445:2551-3357(+)